jgi:hypothetical protein
MMANLLGVVDPRRAISYDEIREDSLDGMLTRLALDDRGPGGCCQPPLFAP